KTIQKATDVYRYLPQSRKVRIARVVIKAIKIQEAANQFFCHNQKLFMLALALFQINRVFGYEIENCGHTEIIYFIQLFSDITQRLYLTIAGSGNFSPGVCQGARAFQ